MVSFLAFDRLCLVSPRRLLCASQYSVDGGSTSGVDSVVTSKGTSISRPSISMFGVSPVDITLSYMWEVASPNRLDSLLTRLEAFQSMFDFNFLRGRLTVAVAESFSFSQCPRAYILLT